MIFTRIRVPLPVYLIHLYHREKFHRSPEQRYPVPMSENKLGY